MKNNICILILTFTMSLLFASCLKEENTSDPVINSVQMFMSDVNNKDSLVTTVPKGKKVKFVISTNADMVSVWPGGIRTVMKKKNSTADSLDMFNHPVLEVSDSYEDYGLVKARGLNTTVGNNGWYVSYTYPNAGEFDLTIVATNHGYNSPDLRRVIYNAGTVKVQ